MDITPERKAAAYVAGWLKNTAKTPEDFVKACANAAYQYGVSPAVALYSYYKWEA